MQRLDRMQLNMVRFCANECHNQRSGEKSVARMIEAYNHALLERDCGNRFVSESFVTALAYLIEPEKNLKGYRQTPVSFANGSLGEKAEHIQRQMDLLLENQEGMTLDEFTKRFLDIHPFEDGNGRLASILYNYLDSMLEAPQKFPDYYSPIGAF